MNEVSSIIVMRDGIAHIAIGHMFVMLAIGSFFGAMLIGAFGAYDTNDGTAGDVGAIFLLLAILFAFLAAITWAVEHLAVVR